MKRIVVFLVSFLLLVFVSISGSGNNAFAKDHNWSPPPPQVVNLVCSVITTNDPTTDPPTTKSAFQVLAFSETTNVTAALKVGDECAMDLANLLAAGLKIKNVQAVPMAAGNGSVVYTLVNGCGD